LAQYGLARRCRGFLGLELFAAARLPLLARLDAYFFCSVVAVPSRGLVARRVLCAAKR